jgi:SAM-dependent methyltransferase
MRKFLKRLFFPGFDLHTRSRYRHLPRFFRAGPIDTLDAGCGNGALSYAAYRKGNRVTAISFDRNGITKNVEHFRSFTDPERLKFEVGNLYDLPERKQEFDQIICSETLEHIRDDKRIIQSFYDSLRDGGVLHLCCPYALHPVHNLGRVNGPEDGGHVRDGYTFETYRELLEPVGFTVVRRTGLGSATLERMDKLLRSVRTRGDIWASPLFLMFLPFLGPVDRLNPVEPFSIYVEAVKTAPRH